MSDLDVPVPDEQWRQTMLQDLSGPELDKATDALLSLTFNDPDGAWVEGVLLEHLDSTFDRQIRSLAATCLGHLARIHGEIGKSAVARLEQLQRQGDFGGLIDDVLDDIRRFAR